MYRRQGSRPSPRKRNAKKQNGCLRRNAEFQRIARRDKKGFLGDQCKEIEENNRMGKTSLVAQRLKRESACNAGDLGLIPGLGRSPGKGNGNPLQYSCLENPMDGGVWWAAVHGVTKSRTRLSDFIFTFHFHALEKEMAGHSSVLAW